MTLSRIELYINEGNKLKKIKIQQLVSLWPNQSPRKNPSFRARNGIALAQNPSRHYIYINRLFSRNP